MSTKQSPAYKFDSEHNPPRTPTERAEAILERYRGQDNEWATLFAVIRMSEGWSCSDAVKLMDLVDCGPLARRLDEMRGEMLRRAGL